MDPNTSQHPPLPNGSDIGGYDITRTLGSGTFGIVYRAEGHVLKDPVAIKEFFPRDIADRVATGQVTPKQDHAEEFAWALDRFVSEAKTLRRLAEPEPHPNIIQVRHVIEKNGTSYFVMKWEEGEALEAVLKREPPWDEERLRRLLDALLAGLEHVHNADVLHRDIKPSNILIRPDGTPVLIDFGSARRVSGDQDLSKYVQLTPAFAPPEQQYGQYGKWTDIYSLAATLFYALTGHKPDPAVAARPRLADELQGRYTDGFLRGLDEALELNYRERPQSVAEWRSSLGLGPDRSTTDPLETRPGTPSGDSEATIVMPQPGLDRHRQTGQADSPTVVLSAPSDPRTASESPAIDPGRPDLAGDESRSKRADWWRTHWLSTLSLVVVTGIMALLAWLWVERNGGGVIPGQARPPEQSYQDPVPAPSSQSPESGASATRDESTPPPGQEPSPHAEVAAPPTVVIPSKPSPAPPTSAQPIADVLEGFDCTPLQVERLAEGDYAISGHVAGQTDLRRLDAELGAIAQATIDISGVSVVPRPLCPLLKLIGPYSTARRLAIVPNHPSGHYTTGDDFRVAFRNSDQASGRLYAFYIGSAGEVYAPPEAFNQLLYVGAEVGLTGYEASAPPGTDLILALWCRGVTLPQHLGEPDRIEGFLPALEEALKEHTPNCGTAWRFIEIH
ncbi:serine/threonine protein kinase [Candidatus Thiosymbion oneisti]|uniref:serine/threonine protein kinase n=1 Tax=Candidatus Thiosymbion oneisti TaxID=589554 RepID=UPI00159F1A66|nr:serine/threonine-protein kinase [Candidatus Thiosymbion oneisti]